MKNSKPLIGFIGQGWIGKNYADDFESRGYKTVRYSLEEKYIKNKNFIKECDIVFIAVPTPTTPSGFDSSIVRNSIRLVGKGKIAVIKSTILPGTGKRFQKAYPDRIVIYSPEFLSEATAMYDVSNPFSSIVGIAGDSLKHKRAASLLLKVLRKSPLKLVCSSTEAEIIKYTHNGSGYVQIMLFNMMYDIARKLRCDWDAIYKAISVDPLICNRYAQPVHKSGRGAGGSCFIKDVAAIRELYAKLLPMDSSGIDLWKSLEKKNIALLTQSGKDMILLKGVYGKDPKSFHKSSGKK